MPVRSISEGERWGRLQCIKSEYVDRPVIVADGVEEITKVVRYTIQCECKKKLKIWEHHFKGKRKMRDCGCGISTHDTAPVRLNIYLPQRMFTRIKKYATENGWDISDAVGRLVEGHNHEWNWRAWTIHQGLPEEVWRKGVGLGEFKIHTSISVPQLLAKNLAIARKYYNRSINQLVLGMVKRALYGPDMSIEFEQELKESQQLSDIQDQNEVQEHTG